MDKIEKLIPDRPFLIYRGVGGRHKGKKEVNPIYTFRITPSGKPSIVVATDKSFDRLIKKVIKKLGGEK